MINWKTKGTELYQQLPAEMHAYWKSCEPLRILPDVSSSTEENSQTLYKTWNTTRTS